VNDPPGPDVAGPVRFVPLLVLCLVGCATVTSVAQPESSEADWEAWPVSAPPPPTPVNQLALKAGSLVGLSTLRLAAPHLPDDCTGLVRAVYDSEGIALMGAGQSGDNGVTAMYRRAFERSALHTTTPEPGDLVFFRETYDRNRDGKENDGLTHVGVVEAVAPDGTVTFVHRSGSGVTRARMNLAAPLDKHRNDFLRPKKKDSPALLTGELFVAFASAVKLR
jgi:cell wall-associated NlpC family hydrolase